jgi:hypothetical protein
MYSQCSWISPEIFSYYDQIQAVSKIVELNCFFFIKTYLICFDLLQKSLSRRVKKKIIFIFQIFGQFPNKLRNFQEQRQSATFKR